MQSLWLTVGTQLATICERKFGKPGERALLFSNSKYADACRSYMRHHSPTLISVRVVEYTICPPSANDPQAIKLEAFDDIPSCIELYVVFSPTDSWALAKSYWQHTGNGISSRMGERCLASLGISPEESSSDTTNTKTKANDVLNKPSLKSSSRYGSARYQQKGMKSPSGINTPTLLPPTSIATPISSNSDQDQVTLDHTAYLEERYGRNLPLSSSHVAKRALKRRIAGVLLRDITSVTNAENGEIRELLGADESELEGKGIPVERVLGESTRGVKNVKEDDVWLYPTGMSAIWHSHQLAMSVRSKEGEVGKTICFG